MLVINLVCSSCKGVGLTDVGGPCPQCGGNGEKTDIFSSRESPPLLDPEEYPRDLGAD